MKKLVTLLLAFVMVLSLAACAAPKTETPPDTTAAADITDTTTALKKITVTVVHKDGSSKNFTYETDEEFLGPVLEADGLIKGNAGPYGMEITHVDGEQAIYDTDKAYWALYEGAEYALQGIDTTPVTDGGTYKLEYTGA